MPPAKKSTKKPKKSKREKCHKSLQKKCLNNVSKEIYNPDNDLFDYEEIHPLIKDQCIDALEATQITAQGKCENNSTLIFNLDEKAWWVLNNGTRFFGSVKLEKSKITTSSGATTFGDWEACEASDKSNIKFYGNFLRKKFNISLFQNDQMVKLSQSFSSIQASIETFLLANQSLDQKKDIFGGWKMDSSQICLNKKSDYALTNETYKDFTAHFFTSEPVIFSFTPLCIPWSNMIDDDKCSLKNMVIPQIDEKRFSIRVGIYPNDALCFYQTNARDTLRYRLNVTNLNLYLYKIRWGSGIGYSLALKKITKPNTKSRLRLPSFLSDTYVDNCPKDADFVLKTFHNVLPPDYILIFKCNPLLLNPNSAETYPASNLDSWHQMYVESVGIHIDGLNLFDECPNLFQTNNEYMNLMSLIKLRKNFINNWKLDPNITSNLLQSTDYNFPNILIDFKLLKNFKINPIMGTQNHMNNPCKIDVKLTFDTSETITSGSLIYYFIYSNKNVNLSLCSGHIFNPLINPNCN